MSMFRSKRLEVPVGMLYSFWAPIATEPDNALPTYGDVEDMGHARTGNLTVATTQTDIYGDNRRVYHLEQFDNGTLQAETTMDDLAVNAKILGRTNSSGEVTGKIDDTAPFGGYAWIEDILNQSTGIDTFRVTYLPKVQAQLASFALNAATRQQSMEPRMNTITYSVYAAKTGAYIVQKDFATEAAAIAAIEGYFGVS